MRGLLGPLLQILICISPCLLFSYPFEKFSERLWWTYMHIEISSHCTYRQSSVINCTFSIWMGTVFPTRTRARLRFIVEVFLRDGFLRPVPGLPACLYAGSIRAESPLTPSYLHPSVCLLKQHNGNFLPVACPLSASLIICPSYLKKQQEKCECALMNKAYLSSFYSTFRYVKKNVTIFAFLDLRYVSINDFWCQVQILSEQSIHCPSITTMYHLR